MYTTETPVKDGPYKFVKMEDGTYRWMSVYNDHCNAVKTGEKPVAAGTLMLLRELGYWTLAVKWSMTLEISSGPTEIDEISKLLNLAHKERDK